MIDDLLRSIFGDAGRSWKPTPPPSPHPTYESVFNKEHVENKKCITCGKDFVYRWHPAQQANPSDPHLYGFCSKDCRRPPSEEPRGDKKETPKEEIRKEIPVPPTEDQDLEKVKDRIRKLMALSRSSNGAESLSALSKAHSLLKENDLTWEQVFK